jgi:hypothetical protein
MGSNLCYANTVTPRPSETWSQLSSDERLSLVRNTLTISKDEQYNIISAIEAMIDGQVIVRLLEPVSSDKRGSLLLNLEAFLKESIDPGLVIWLEPLRDLSSLRNLRGIKVKS